MEWLIVTVASLFAGFVDAIVGGGGLVLVPALFAAYPHAAPASLVGTNKIGAIWGTTFAAWKYARTIEFRWATIGPAVVAAFIGSLLGSWTVTMVSADILRKILPFVLIAVLAYTLARKDMGQAHRPMANRRREQALAMLIGLGIGFYDGLFGPGTGSFLVFAFVRLLGFDFLNASAHAKLVNIATNGASILLLGAAGYIWWHLMIPLAVANILGSVLGTHMALRYGSGFVRWVFVAVVGLLICRTAWDAFLR